jgi:hypothetical protein
MQRLFDMRIVNDHKYYEEELDEMLLAHNPNGGRPQTIGSILWPSEDRDGVTEVSVIKEDSALRYMLGYCLCGRKVVIGQKRAGVLAEVFRRRSVKPYMPSVPWRLKLARLLLGK